MIPMEIQHPFTCQQCQLQGKSDLGTINQPEVGAPGSKRGSRNGNYGCGLLSARYMLNAQYGCTMERRDPYYTEVPGRLSNLPGDTAPKGQGWNLYPALPASKARVPNPAVTRTPWPLDGHSKMFLESTSLLYP